MIRLMNRNWIAVKGLCPFSPRVTAAVALATAATLTTSWNCTKRDTAA